MREFHEIVWLLHDREARADELTSEELSLTDGVGENLVHYLSLESDPDIVEALIARGVSCDEFSEHGTTPLMDCAFVGFGSMVSLLLDHGADPNKVSRNGRGETSLHLALRGRKPEIVSLLIGRGARVDIQDACGDSALEIASWMRLHDIWDSSDWRHS